MKKMIKFFALAAIAALACVSCNKEIEVSVVPENEGINVTLRAEPITKTYIEGTTPKWKATDAIGVFTGADTQNHKFTNTSASGEDAVFNGSVTSAGTYYAYYPYSTSGVNVEKGGADFKFPETQYPTPTSFDGAADLLLSESFSIASTDPENISVRFRRLGAFLKFTFTDGTGGKLSGEHAAKVSVIVNNADDSKRPCPRVYVTPSGIGEVGSGMKTINAIYDDGVYELTASGKATWFGILPQTFTTGSTFAITIDTGKYTISKTLTLSSNVEVSAGDVLPIRVTITDGDLTAKKLQRVWYMISRAGKNWGTDIRVGDVYMNANDQARSVAMDDEKIYLPKSSAYPAIFAVSIADKSSISLVSTTGFTGTTFKSSFARIMKNEDGEVNGGKDILVVSNLSAGNEDAPFEIRAFNNGINNSSTRLAAFIWDTANSVNDWRRYGDRFFVTGTYQSGAVYCPSFNAGKSVILGITNGARSSVTQIYTATKTEGIIDATVYPGGSKILFSNASLGLWAASDGGTNNGWTTYPAITAEAAQKSFGYNFFTYKGTSYIARVMLEDTTHARLQVFEDPTGTEEGFLSAISAAPIAEAPLQDLSDYSVASPFSSGQVDCAVRIISDQVYIAALMSNGGLSLFKLALD